MGVRLRAALLLCAVGCSDGTTSHDAKDAGGPTAPAHLSDLPMGRWVEALTFSPDGATLWAATENQVGSMDGETRAWTVSKGATLATIAGPSWAVSLDPTGKNVAVGGPAVSVLDAGTQQAVRSLAGTQGAVAFSPNGKWIAASAPATGQVLVFSAADGSMVASVAHPVVTNERMWRVVFSPDSSLLATASGQNGLGSPHGSTFVWKTADWSKLASITCTTFDAAFSPDGATLALACWLDVRLVSTKDFTTTKMLKFGTESMSVAWSPDGTKLAVGGFSAGAASTTLQVYSSAGDPITALTDGQSGPTIKALAWSPDGKSIAGGGWDDPIVRIWPAP